VFELFLSQLKAKEHSDGRDKLSEQTEGEAKQSAVNAFATKQVKEVMKHVTVVTNNAASEIKWEPGYIKPDHVEAIWNTM
jgi:hypothetical protein